jgi:hypothetical protein
VPAEPYGSQCVIEEDFSVGNRGLPVARTVLAFLAASLLTACDSASPTGPSAPDVTTRPSADLGDPTAGVELGGVPSDSVSSIYAVAYEEPPASEGGEGSTEP